MERGVSFRIGRQCGVLDIGARVSALAYAGERQRLKNVLRLKVRVVSEDSSIVRPSATRATVTAGIRSPRMQATPSVEGRT
jgi:hypothetical protein